MNYKGYMFILGICTLVTCLVLGVARDGKSAHADTSQTTKESKQSVSVSPAQVRSGGKLTDSEMDALKTLQDKADARRDEIEMRFKQWQRKAPTDRVIDDALQDDAMEARIDNVRITLWLRRVADRHSLDVTCFSGSVDEAGRNRCGENLWGFDAKTGDIHLAPKSTPPPNGSAK